MKELPIGTKVVVAAYIVQCSRNKLTKLRGKQGILIRVQQLHGMNLATVRFGLRFIKLPLMALKAVEVSA